MVNSIQTLTYFPGQKATVFLETVNNTGVPADGSANPAVQRIIFPDLTLAADFPQEMIKLDIGLYYFQFTLPINATAIGSYLVDILYNDPTDSINKRNLYHIIVNAPYGLYSVGVN